ncbi:MAG: tRNA preQ1(34) S-adenosylmethionine ribosyltransferase-isomerase QueA [Patescibacteria group bacterium]
MTLKTSDFFYHLPNSLIAQKPIRPRDHSRLLLLDKKSGLTQHKHFYNLPDYLKKGDLLILNNSKVFPARLIGHKKLTGGQVEIFLHQPSKGKNRADNIWECLVGGRVKEGSEIEFSKAKNKLNAKIINNNQDGTWLVSFDSSGDKFWLVVNKIGEVPLPPYIKRSKQLASDKNNYQTVFADKNKVGSAAAPTAGLHFTKGLLKKIRDNGVVIKYVTLHVGLGTFAPVKEEKITDHKMHSEFASISAETIKEILKTKKLGGRIIAVGTTSCRTLESLNWVSLRKQNKIQDQAFWTDIFIYPGYNFKIVDALITNFHLPASTLLMLISALAGKSQVDFAYQEAVRRKYRFFSYGDAMFIS